MPEHTEHLDTMTHAYAVCALWSSCAYGAYPDEEQADETLDAFFTPDDLTPETAEEFRSDCADFLEVNAEDISLMMAQGFGPEQIGHDFWLTRNGHGAGFWDRGLGELGDRLADAARVYGSVDLYVTGGDTSPEQVSS